MILFALWWSSLLIGEGMFESFHTWLKAFYNCHNWPSRWFPTLIMRISHLIQTIQPDPQILTSAHERDSFSKKNNSNNKKNSCMNKAYFILIFHWLLQQWSRRPDMTKKNSLRTLISKSTWLWTKQPQTPSCMCHSFSPFNHELSCNSLNSPWHQTKVSVFYIHTYSKMPRI